MAISQAICSSFKNELLQGIHDFTSDTFKAALFSSDADLDADTTAYATTNEISGTGYTAGGKALSVASGYPQLVSGIATVQFDNVAWTGGTFNPKGALIYNSSKSNRAVVVLDFGSNQPLSAGTFTLDFSLIAPTGVVKIA